MSSQCQFHWWDNTATHIYTKLSFLLTNSGKGILLSEIKKSDQTTESTHVNE